MKIPNKIKVGGIVYRIIIQDVEDINQCGETSLDNNTIQIRKSLPQNQREVTLFHEIIHCMNWKLEEDVVEYMAQSFYQVLKENKLIK